MANNKLDKKPKFTRGMYGLRQLLGIQEKMAKTAKEQKGK